MAAIKEVPARKWNPEGKFWTIPDTPEVRTKLADVFAASHKTTESWIEIKPKSDEQAQRRPCAPYVPGKSKPLLTNPPHPLMKAVDDELVLREMAYCTRKSYGQHLRNYFAWLQSKHIAPEQATC